MRTSSHPAPPPPPDGSPRALHSRRRQLVKWTALSGFAVLGMCAVSVPLTVAVVLSTTGASDLITLGSIDPRRHHTTPARAIADLRCVPTRGHYALTVDGGPMPATSARLVAALSASRGVATFFDVGQRAAAHQDLVELQRSVGVVANQAYSGRRMTEVSQDRRYQELQAAAKALDYPNAFFRPPHGATNPAVEADVRRSGLNPVYWTVDASQPALSKSEIVDLALRVQPGGIIRLADGSGQTVEAIPEIVARQRERGMCPGLISTTKHDVVGANGRIFNAVAVKP